MMKEWKNNPESDEDRKTDEETEQPTKEKLNQIRGKTRDVNHSASAKTAKQVGGIAKAGTRLWHFHSRDTLLKLHHLTVSNKGLHQSTVEVLLLLSPGI